MSSPVEHVKLYLITDDKRSGGRDVVEIVKAAVAGGVQMIQYRPWQISDADYKLNTLRIRRITREAGVVLLVNARPDIAIQCGAEGVQIGRKSMIVSVARRRMFDGGVVGYSAHSLEEAVKAEQEGADFVTFSPIFQTASSSEPRPVVGVDALKEVAEKLSIPVFPLGGINTENVAEIREAGIRRAAVVSAITEAEDVKKAAEEMFAGIIG